MVSWIPEEELQWHNWGIFIYESLYPGSCCDIMLLRFLSLSVVILSPIPPCHPTHIKQIAEGFPMSAPPSIDEQVPALISESDTVSLFNCRSKTVYSAPPTLQPTFTLHCSLSFSSFSRRQPFHCPVRPHTRMWEHTNTLWLCFLEMFLLNNSFVFIILVCICFHVAGFYIKTAPWNNLSSFVGPAVHQHLEKSEKYFVYCSTCHISAQNIDETSFPQGYSEDWSEKLRYHGRSKNQLWFIS